MIGRQVYWRDFTTNQYASALDFHGHGSHVAGIALGTGAGGGVSGPLLLSQNNDLYQNGNPLAPGYFFTAPFHGPSGSAMFTAEARWLGGGRTVLGRYSHFNGDWSWGNDSFVTGTSPLKLNPTIVAFNTTRAYSVSLEGVGNASISNYVITLAVSNFPALDSFNRLRGVAPGCNWAGAKVLNDMGRGFFNDVAAAVDELVYNRAGYKIKVINLSLGGRDDAIRQKINTAVHNGLVVVASAGNNGQATNAPDREVGDPGRAALALTLVSANDVNRLTAYSSEGSTNAPDGIAGQEKDHKPDLMAPGGSWFHSPIESIDSNQADGPAFADQRPNDYVGLNGTSMAAPFAAGCAALVIEALERDGLIWDFNSSDHARLVKMILCATASESNANRESNSNNPTLQRASPGPSSYPAGKDRFEGYGMINADAAVEAVSLTYAPGITESAALGPALSDRRVWARKVTLLAGQQFRTELAVPATGDFDVYLYYQVPTAFGGPVMLASSTRAGSGNGETLNYLASTNTSGLLVVKRISGSGTFNLLGTSSPAIVEQPAGRMINEGGSVTFGVLADGSKPLSYQWYLGSTALAGATASHYTRTNAQWLDSGDYTVVITNFLGSITSAVAHLRVNRYPVADASATPLLAVSPDGVAANVVLNGSGSSDPDGDPLTFRWYETGTGSTLAEGMVAVASLPVGTRPVELVVNDAMAWSTQALHMEVITATEAVGRLAATLGSTVPRPQPLLAALHAAMASLDRSNPVAAINQLLAFQNQVRAQVSPLDSVVGASLIQTTQELIDTLTGSATNPGGRPHARFTAMTGDSIGQVRMQFQGANGAIHLIEASTNLMDWELIGAGIRRAEGEFEFEDTRTTQFSQRFYRVRSL